MTIDSELATAQQAIELPEVQEMVRRLAAYGLGVSLPHMHDSAGNMLPLPAGVVQVEEDMVVSFRPAEQVRDTPEAVYVSVGWGWSDLTKSATPQTVCRVEKQSDGNYKHVKTSYGH